MWQVLADYLPHCTALLNAAATVVLALGLIRIRQGNPRGHKKMMLTALGISALFLLLYLLHKVFDHRGAEYAFSDRYRCRTAGGALHVLRDPGHALVVGDCRTVFGAACGVFGDEGPDRRAQEIGAIRLPRLDVCVGDRRAGLPDAVSVVSGGVAPREFVAGRFSGAARAVRCRLDVLAERREPSGVGWTF